MAFTKITDKDRNGKGNVGMPDTPNLSTYQMQQKMDELPNLAIEGLNKLIDELSSTSAAANIGADVPVTLTASANVQALINALASAVSILSGLSHSHGNKSLLDSLTNDNIVNWNAVASLFSAINGIQSSATDSIDQIPNSHAVVKAINDIDYKPIVLNYIYPIGSVYFTTTIANPKNIFGGTWEQIGVINGSYSWKRTA